jgi:hypothetical protein
LLAAVLAAAALSQEIEASNGARIVRRGNPERGASGFHGERTDRGENFNAEVAETGAGGHDQYSLLLVWLVRLSLAGSFPPPTIPR